MLLLTSGDVETGPGPKNFKFCDIVIGLIFKLKTNGIDGNLLKLLINYLEDRKQRVVLNGETSSLKNILAGVPQGSVLGPILFLIYINDLPDGIKSICKIFADGTSLFSKVKDKNCPTVELNNDIKTTKINETYLKLKFI